MIGAVTDLDFDRLVERSPVPVLIAFWKPGCGGCRVLMRQLGLLQADLADSILMLQMNVDENFQIPAELEIRSLPALALYRNGQFDRFIGGIGTKEAIRNTLSSALSD
ncbi:Thioredoxin [Nitrospira sp. KM1]|uniref:thioredoxin family protein n=1 Tax=Nitrospira sp. KM1 TaxID=1936990 RepID=UPI0013A7A904|nr:thioredoxin domain-containing protein [Nitrospira sp. KM1]BCA53855.1 Thioredoxin [Nitrospira sp. KM1]